jgi:glycosyltransferase involved in cell wall biosynthesis
VTDVSVVIPCFRAGDFLLESVQSALSQRGVDVEVIVVDDGSDDDATKAALTAVAAQGVDVIRRENGGPSAARNTGIAAASGELILPLDADDRLSFDALRLMVQAVRDADDVGIVCGAVQLFGEVSRVEPCVYSGVQSMLDGTSIANTSMFRRTDWARVGGYPDALRLGEDWAFWMRILALGREVAVLDEVVYEYRIWHAQTVKGIGPVDVATAKNFVLEEHPDVYALHMDYLTRELATQRMLLAQFRETYGWQERLRARVRSAIASSPFRRASLDAPS